ncbi:MAG: phosphatase PAP2 family protein [Sphingobacteriales bacterium]|nr:phosphatase PAP2 family protein [Sphingobacteriales bacterium]
MKNSLSFIRNNSYCFLALLMAVTSGFVFLILNGKASSFIALNSFHPFWLNVFFINYTFMGDGIFAIGLIAVMAFYFKKKKEAIALLYAFLFSGLMVQLIKNLVNAPRPRLFFEPGQYLYFVDQVSMANNSSFPSGHTATAFAIATVFIILIKNKKWQLPILAAAVLVGFSRIYLAQHFLMDVLVGAIIGIASGLLAVSISMNIKSIRISFRKMHRIEKKISQSGSGNVMPA